MEKTPGFIFMLEGLLVKTALMAPQDVRGMKEKREFHRGLTDFLHPTHFKRAGLQTRMEKSDFNLNKTDRLNEDSR